MKKEFNCIGKSIPRRDVIEQVTGAMKFGVDTVLPGMIYGKLLTSPLPHARIVNIDTSKAEKLPGVRAICTAENFPHDLSEGDYYDQPSVLASKKVRFYGEPILGVAADTPSIAEEALQLIKIEYEALPFILDPLEALKTDSYPIHKGSNIVAHNTFSKGDIEKGFEQADEFIIETMRTQQQEHVHLEPHAVVAEYNRNLDFYTLWLSTQKPFNIAKYISIVLQIPQNKFRIITTNVGGAFGGKGEITLEPVSMILAKKARRPVKMEYTREEEFLCSTNRHSYIMTYKTGVKKDGKITARYISILSDCGAYTVSGKRTLKKACVFAAGAYDIPNIKVDASLVYTNKTSGGAVRGYGTPQVYFASETHMDTIAVKLKMDPMEFRLKNIFKDGNVNITGQVLSNVKAEKTLRKVIERSGWFERGTEQ